MLPGTVCFSQTVGVDSSEAVFKADRACCDTGMVGDLLERSGFPGWGCMGRQAGPQHPDGLAGLQSPEVNGLQGTVVSIVLSPS